MEERMAKLEARVARLEKIALCEAGIIDISDGEAEVILSELATEHFGEFILNEIKTVFSDIGMEVEHKEET